jgi:hypothetical protein
VEERAFGAEEEGKKEIGSQAEQTYRLYYNKGVITLYLQASEESPSKEAEEISHTFGRRLIFPKFG